MRTPVDRSSDSRGGGPGFDIYPVRHFVSPSDGSRRVVVSYWQKYVLIIPRSKSATEKCA